MADWVDAVAPWRAGADWLSAKEGTATAREQRKATEAESAARVLEVARQRELERERAAVQVEVDRIIAQLNSEADAAAKKAAQLRAAANATMQQASDSDAIARAAEEHSAAWERLLSTLPVPPYADVEALRGYRMLLLQSGREMATRRAGGLSGLAAITGKVGTLSLAGAAVGAVGLMRGGAQGHRIALVGAALFGLGLLWERP